VPIPPTAEKVIGDLSKKGICPLATAEPPRKPALADAWAALAGQFGAGIKLRKHFKPAFTEGLGLAQAVYRDARIEVTETGVILKPSPPPVRKLAKQGVAGGAASHAALG
jgi:hypothetical protein